MDRRDRRSARTARNEPDLLGEAEAIRHPPVLDEPPIDHAGHVDDGDVDPASNPGQAHEGSIVRGGGVEAQPDAVVGGGNILGRWTA